jgi:SAM-dependent methyltransferase
MPPASPLKQAYFSGRNAGLAKAGARALMGERELVTLGIIARLNGDPGLFERIKGETMVDAGCGDRFLEQAATARHLVYRGLDIADVDFEHGLWPVADASAALVISLAVIEHLHDPGRFLSEAMRVLKPGGLLWLSTPNFQLDARNFYNDPTHVKPYTPFGLEALLRMSGFEAVATFPGLRCKPDFYYSGPWRFFKGRWLLPFRGQTRFAPDMFKGQSRSIFALAGKPA